MTMVLSWEKAGEGEVESSRIPKRESEGALGEGTGGIINTQKEHGEIPVPGTSGTWRGSLRSMAE